MQAPLGPAATPALVAAVSTAGGLGCLPASWTPPKVLREQIREIRRSLDGPFCVNLVLDFDQAERLELLAEERVPAISFSWGVDADAIARARAAGATVLVQVADAGAARTAVAAGAGALIAEEADVHPKYLERLLAARAEDTELTGLFDVGWPDAPHRVLRNATLDRWQVAGGPSPGSRPGEGEPIATRFGRPIVRYADAQPTRDTEGDVVAMALYAGMGVGDVRAVEGAGDITRRLGYNS